MSEHLTPAEREVLRLLAEDRRADEIAITRHTTYSAIRGQIRRTKEKLDVRTLAGAIAKAMRMGLI